MTPPSSTRPLAAGAPGGGGRAGLRRTLAGFYFAWFAALGLFVPYFALYLRSVGLSEGGAGRMLSLLPAVGLVAPPLLGFLADARRARPHLIRLGAAASTASFALLLAVPQRWGPIALVVIVFSLVRSPVGALVDAAAADSTRGGMGFGRLRLWGSLGFLLAVLAGGALFDRFGLGLQRGLTTLGLALATALAWNLEAPPSTRVPGATAAWFRLLADPGLRRLLLAVALAQMAAAAYDACFALHLSRLGWSRGGIGVALALGVLAEVVLLAWRPRWLAAVPAERLFGLTLAVAAARWLLLSFVDRPALVLLLQPLHGVTFGLWFVSAVALCRSRGQALPTAAQGLLSAASSSGSAIGMALSGQLLAEGGGALMFGAAAAVAAVAHGVARGLVPPPAPAGGGPSLSPGA